MPYKYHFFDDYSEGAHPNILEALNRTNFQQEVGYGMDSFALEATDLIRDKIFNREADVYFVSSGTHANLVCIASILKPYESVIASNSGHISLHETGAIEATGHKINSVDAPDGKLKPEAILKVIELHNFDQMVKPRIVYISESTELGTVYTKDELEAISNVCKDNGLFLYIDGARLGAALTYSEANLDLPTIARLADIFYIGGTKNGGLIGEAIVITNTDLKENFRYHLRQRGALLAKARVVSVQFLEFFKNELYLDCAKHSNDMAQKLAMGIKVLGYDFLENSPTNQIFPIFADNIIEKLKENYGFHFWSKVDANHSAIRLVTSWATSEDAIVNFLNDLKVIS